MRNISKKDIIEYIIITIITFIVFIPFLVGHYATDTYNIYNMGYTDYAIKYSLNDGRIFMAILGLIAGKLNIPINVYVFITLAFALLISCISVMTIYKIIQKYKKPKNFIQELILIIISYVTIFNFMYIENMYFVESIVMAISILLFIISANMLIGKQKYYSIKSTILTILGILCYQGTIGMFITFVTLFTIIKNKNSIKQIILDLLECYFSMLIAAVIDFTMIKISGYIFNMNQNRILVGYGLTKNLMIILYTLPISLCKTFELFPKYLLLIFLLCQTGILMTYAIKNTKERKSIILKYIFLVSVTIASSYIISLLTLTSFEGGRLKNPLGALIGITFLFLYTDTNIFDKTKKLSVCSYIILFAYLVVNIINYENIMMEHKKVNLLEREYAEQMEEYIEVYEKSTGIKVKNITKVNNRKQSPFFKETKRETQLTYNAYKCGWSGIGVVNYYTKRNLEAISINSEKQKNIINNYDFSNGYICIDDTLYIEICQN